MKKSKKVSISPLRFLREYRNNDHGFLRQLIEERGRVFTVDAYTSKMHFFLDPKYIKHVLIDKRDIYIKPPAAFKILGEFLGEYGLVNTNNQKIWQKDRIALAPLVNIESLKQKTRIITDVTTEHLDSWKEYEKTQKPLSIDTAMSVLTLDNLLKSFFGNIKIDLMQAHDLIKEVLYLMSPYALSYIKLLGIVPSNFFLHHKRIKSQMIALSDEIIKYCKSDEAPKNNLIKALIGGYPDAEQKEFTQHLRGETLMFLVAGYETTAVTLIWTCVYLSLYPLIAQKVYEEVNQVLGGRTPTYDDLEKLTYTRATIFESLRIQPAVDYFVRAATQDDVIGQHKISRGDFVWITPYYMHRLPDYWPNPEGFDPDRFLSPLGERYQCVYLPFSVGPRACYGKQYAIIEATLTLAMLMQRYQLWLTSDFTWDREKTSLNKLSQHLTMTVHGRK